jgi:predicted secreted Zn-dependent protease
MRRSLLIFILAIPSVLFAQKSNEELLEWNADRQLGWSDYKSKPNPESDAAASTTTYLSVEYNITSTRFSYKIKSYFSKTRSWGLHKTDYILSHEQGHFDIAEVFARKLHKKLSEYKFNKKTYQKDLQKIYEEVTKEKSDTQNEYDRQTNHSINKEKQAEWLKKIEEMLEEYAAYSDY